jgi:membrane protease YdiL (CAAX protease family)
MAEQSPNDAPEERGIATTGVAGNRLDNLFTKPEGLRAGWRLLIYVVIFLALWISSSYILVQIFHPRRDVFSPGFQLAGESASFLSAVIAAWVMAIVEDRSVELFGLPAIGAFGKLFWQGCLFGLAEIFGLVGTIAALRGYSFGSLAEHGFGIVRWALFWGGFFVVVGFFEEFFFRGYTLYTMAEGIGFWPAAVALSLCFGAVHRQNVGENWIGVAGVVLVGLFWCFTLKRTGSLWFAVGMHAAFDFGETFLFSVPDSGMVFPGHLSNATLQGPSWLTGGLPGPEASLIDFAILLLFFVIFDRVYPAQETAGAGVVRSAA